MVKTEHIEKIFILTGVIVWMPIWLPILCVMHVSVVIPAYWRWWTIPFSPWKKNAKWYHIVRITLLAPNYWIYRKKVDFRAPDGSKYHILESNKKKMKNSEE